MNLQGAALHLHFSTIKKHYSGFDLTAANSHFNRIFKHLFALSIASRIQSLSQVCSAYSTIVCTANLSPSLPWNVSFYASQTPCSPAVCSSFTSTISPLVRFLLISIYFLNTEEWAGTPWAIHSKTCLPEMVYQTTLMLAVNVIHWEVSWGHLFEHREGEMVWSKWLHVTGAIRYLCEWPAIKYWFYFKSMVSRHSSPSTWLFRTASGHQELCTWCLTLSLILLQGEFLWAPTKLCHSLSTSLQKCLF